MDAARLKFIIQKRTSLKRYVTQLKNALDNGEQGKNLLQHKFNHEKKLFINYENLHDEWSAETPEDARLEEFDEIQDNYFSIASKINETAVPIRLNDSATTSTNLSINSETVTVKQQLKLPIAEIPKFSGDYTKWLTFKNTFKTMIDSCSDLDDVSKFVYLKTVVKGEALNKISLLDYSPENYQNAWSFLEKAYEVKKIIVSRHLQGILGLPVVEKESHESLVKLIDEVQQHVSALVFEYCRRIGNACSNC